MIIEYHRPHTLEDAVALLSRSDPLTLPLGGGTVLNCPAATPFAVVDLQSLPLNQITNEGNLLSVGATTTLEQLLQYEGIPNGLARAIHLEASYNLRQMGTVAGCLVSADGRSPFAAALLAMDAALTWEPGGQEISLGDWLPMRAEKRPGKLISKVSWSGKARLAFHTVSRTPEDRPLVIAAAAGWPSGRVRLVLGGYGLAPILAMDGPEGAGAETAARDAFSHAGDAFASAEYRMEAAAILARRGAQDLAVE